MEPISKLIIATFSGLLSAMFLVAFNDRHDTVNPSANALWGFFIPFFITLIFLSL